MAQLNGELDGAAMFLAVAQFNRAACACDLRSRMDPKTVPGGTIRKNPAKPIRVRNWQVHRYKPDWGRFCPTRTARRMCANDLTQHAENPFHRCGDRAMS